MVLQTNYSDSAIHDASMRQNAAKRLGESVDRFTNASRHCSDKNANKILLQCADEVRLLQILTPLAMARRDLLPIDKILEKSFVSTIRVTKYENLERTLWTIDKTAGSPKAIYIDQHGGLYSWHGFSGYIEYNPCPTTPYAAKQAGVDLAQLQLVREGIDRLWT